MNSYTETFSLPSYLMGLALGQKWMNLKKARTLKGVEKVHFNSKDRTITITGYNEEIVKIVRDLLEYSEREIPIARSLSDLLLHNHGSLIQKIVDQSGLVRAEVHCDDIDKLSKKQSEFVILKFVGTMSSIDEAKSCIKTLMNSPEYADFQAKKVAENKPQFKFSEEFKISRHLVGLAMGKNGFRIENARKLSGIVKIEQQDADNNSSTFKVYSNDYESMKEAREMLEIAEKKFYIPPNKAGLIIGSKGGTINDIIKTTKVYRMEVKKKEPIESGDIPVVTIGHPRQIEAAKICIESKIGTTIYSLND